MRRLSRRDYRNLSFSPIKSCQYQKDKSGQDSLSPGITHLFSRGNDDPSAELIDRNADEQLRGDDDILRSLTQVLSTVAKSSKHKGLPKITIKSFSGAKDDDATVFITKFTQLTTKHGWSEKERAEYLPFYLEERATRWQDQIPASTKKDFKNTRTKFLDRFFPAKLTQLRTMAMKKDESTRQFADRFAKDLNRYSCLLYTSPSPRDS